jgi:DNA polymerase I-like protein with 3'-5' exonuclease and polymerase domains
MDWAGKYPLINELIRYRKVAKAVQSFSSKLPGHIHPITGRIHPDYWQIGSATGRFSCSNPNLQQIPRDPRFRRCVVPEPGYKLVIADYSQIELRVVAEISDDQRMLQAYGNGDDLHILTASLVAGKLMQEVTKEERQNAKAINFGLIFAMGAEGLQRYAKNTYGVNMILEQARVFKDRFFRAYLGIARWHKAVGHNGSQETRSISGRRRLWDHKPPITELLNTPVQGTAADINKKALGILLGRLAGTGVKIIGTIHDEILLEAPEDQAEQAAGILKAVMIEAGSAFLKKVPVEVEVAIADSWAEK